MLLLLVLPARAGAQAAPGAPGSVTASPGDTSLVVVWDAPASDGGSAITSYDLRYILTGAHDTSDEKWTLLEDAGPVDTRLATLGDLRHDTSYDIQVRAVNANGDGPWSDSIPGATNDHGDARGSATAATLGSTTYGSIEPDDTDWFSFTLSGPGPHDVWIHSSSEAPVDLVGELFDSNAASIGRSDNSYRFKNTRDVSLAKADLDSGTYYVQLSSGAAPGGKRTGAYALRVELAVTPGTFLETGLEITPGAVAADLALGTSHYYRFSLESAAHVSLLVDSDVTDAGLDTVLNLYEIQSEDPFRSLRIGQNDDAPFPENYLGSYMGAGLGPGSYGIQISGFMGNWTGPYVLRFLIEDAPGGTLQSAKTAPFYGLTPGHLSSSSDRDYFRLITESPTWIKVVPLVRGVLPLVVNVFAEDGTDITGTFTESFSGYTGFVSAGTNYIRFGANGRDKHYLLRIVAFDPQQELLEECLGFEHAYQDVLYGCQWHLTNTSQFDGLGQDINIESAWGITLGENVNVAIVDTPLNRAHLDLVDNLVTSRSHSFFGAYDRRLLAWEITHGTSVAGLVAARDNDRGVRGVAPRASIHTVDLLSGNSSDRDDADAMTLHRQVTHVSNNSWGHPDRGTIFTAPSVWESGIETGLTEGAGGKGISYVWAAGNGGLIGDDSNLDGRANHYGVIAACSVDINDTRSEFSEKGANLWVCAPSSGDEEFEGDSLVQADRGITTTYPDGYTSTFGGTSASAPIVSGVIALMRSANPALTWRDVKLILAETARKNDSADGDWEEGALQYGSTTDRYSFNHQYGFGVVDAGAAVVRAQAWSHTLPDLREVTATSTTRSLNIPDPAGGVASTSTSVITAGSFVSFVEFVEIGLHLSHSSVRDLDIDLVAPSGRVSHLMRQGQAYANVFGFIVPTRTGVDEHIRLGSALHLGEDPEGVWTLQVTDQRAGNTGTLEEWSLTLYGHGHTPNAPAIQSFTQGATSLTVAWSAPDNSGLADITSYDLRYIRSDAADKSDTNWTTVSGIWSSGALSYELMGLLAGRRYDVQIRAVNSDGNGLWSPPMSHSTSPIVPEAPSLDAIDSRNGVLLLEWTAPDFDGGAPITTYSFRRVPTTALADADPPWITSTATGTALPAGGFRHALTGLMNEVEYTVQVRAVNRVGNGAWSGTGAGTPDADNTNPEFDDGETAARSVLETVAVGGDVGLPISATDADGDPLTFTLHDGSLGPFSFDETTAQLRVREALDYETTETYTFTLQVRDDQDAQGNSDTANDDSIVVTVTVVDVNESFEIRGATTFTRAEEFGLLSCFKATDPEGKEVTWSKGGEDQAHFNLNEGGCLTMTTRTDWENPADADMNNIYRMQVIASDGVHSPSVDVVVRVTNAPDDPVVEGPRQVTLEENSGNHVASYTATDQDGPKPVWDDLMGADSGKFEFVDGNLRFLEIPNFEARADANRDSVYEVILLAYEEGKKDFMFDRAVVQVTVTDVNEPPELTGPEEVDKAENSARFVGSFSASDPDAGDMASWADLGGPDAADFALDASGRLSFVSSPDYEARNDPVYRVTVETVDQGGLTASRDVTVTVTDVNEAPQVTGPALVVKAENSDVVVGRYAKSDEDAGDTATWGALGGPDARHFVFDEVGGELRFGASPDYDTPLDSGRDNDYNVTLVATDSSNARGQLAVTVRVTDVNEEPEVTGPASVTVDEGHTGEVARYARMDPEGAATNWGPVAGTAALGGADAGRFQFDKATGALRFREPPPDFEDRSRYEVTINANDGRHSVLYAVAVSINNLEEAGEVRLDGRRPILNQTLGAALEDPDGVEGAAAWDWARSRSRGGPWTAISGATSSTYLVGSEDRDRYLRARATYSDALGSGKTAEAVTELPGANLPGSNNPPLLPETVADITIPENTRAGSAVGGRITATDADGDPLQYTVTGSSDFVIDSRTGQLRVASGVELDYETEARYSLTVTVDDGFEGTDTVDVAIVLTDVNEAPLTVDDASTTNEDEAVTIDVLRNDRDPENRPLTASVRSQPRFGSAEVASDGRITYTPRANYFGADSFTYEARDDGSPSRSGAATVSIAIRAVNDDPVFTEGSGERAVSESAEAGDEVGAPVVAGDVDGDTLGYSHSGADASFFEIGGVSGQLTVASGVTFDALVKNAYVVTVTADDRNGGTATIDVTITVTAGPVRPPPPVITGGGGGGGPSGPTPSDEDFEWNVKRDIEALDEANGTPTGMWSDGTTLWLLDNAAGAGDAVYAYDLESGGRVEEREFELDERNRAPRGIWSDGETVWVSDSGRDRLFAHELASGARLPDDEIELASRNRDARGIWSDGTTMWVLDGGKDSLFAYGLASGAFVAEYALHDANGDPHGVWSDGVTIWVSDHGAKRLLAYRLPALPAEGEATPEDPIDLERVRDEEFEEPGRVGNNSPRGLRSDGAVMYVADELDGRVYTYNMPDAIDARLGSLSLEGVDIGEFDPARTDYEGAVAEGVTATVVTAAAIQPRTEVLIGPPDADEAAEGHQVALDGVGEVTVTVTSQDGSRKRVYRVTLPTPADEGACLRGAIAEGFSLVVYEGGSVGDLAACAEERHVVALYVLDGGEWVLYIPGAPEFVNRPFAELFADGVPALLPLIVASDGLATPAPAVRAVTAPFAECLLGEIGEGFSLVVYEGGSVGELGTCAESLGVTALYALVDGEWVPYILGAPAFVNRPFAELFADGVPAATPLTVRGESP